MPEDLSCNKFSEDHVWPNSLIKPYLSNNSGKGGSSGGDRPPPHKTYESNFFSSYWLDPPLNSGVSNARGQFSYPTNFDPSTVTKLGWHTFIFLLISIHVSPVSSLLSLTFASLVRRKLWKGILI